MYIAIFWSCTSEELKVEVLRLKWFNLVCFVSKVEIGDWLYFENMGAYTASAASTFNGFKKPFKYYTVNQQYW